MNEFMKNLVKNIKTGLAVSSEKIEEYSYIGKLKLEISGCRRKQDKLFQKLGNRAFVLIEDQKGTEVASDSEMVEAVEQIKQAEQELQTLKDKLANAPQRQKESPKEPTEDEA